MAESYPNGLKTLWEKKKLLITSNFSFSHSVFKKVCFPGVSKVVVVLEWVKYMMLMTTQQMTHNKQSTITNTQLQHFMLRCAKKNCILWFSLKYHGTYFCEFVMSGLCQDLIQFFFWSTCENFHWHILNSFIIKLRLLFSTKPFTPLSQLLTILRMKAFGKMVGK